MTNRHVLEAVATQDAAGAWSLKWPNETTVNFDGQDGVTAVTKFKGDGRGFAGADAINDRIDFAHLDVAVLRVDPSSDPASAFPKPVTFETDVLQPKMRRDLYGRISGTAPTLGVRGQAAGGLRNRAGDLNALQQQIWRQAAGPGLDQGRPRGYR